MLPPNILLALATFSLVSSITPGPNNLMLLASGVNFGLRRTMPHMLGVGIGFPLMVAVVGLGLSGVFQAAPGLYDALKWMGAAYMLWLAWRIANAGPVQAGEAARGQPMTFLAAAAFQWVNPKAWVMAVTAVATYSVPDRFGLSVLLVAGVFGLVGLPSIGLWAACGLALRRLLADPRHVALFNRAMALLLVASLWPLAAELLH